jgi:hypothetical protein
MLTTRENNNANEARSETQRGGRHPHSIRCGRSELTLIIANDTPEAVLSSGRIPFRLFASTAAIG